MYTLGTHVLPLKRIRSKQAGLLQKFLIQDQRTIQRKMPVTSSTCKKVGLNKKETSKETTLAIKYTASLGEV